MLQLAYIGALSHCVMFVKKVAYWRCFSQYWGATCDLRGMFAILGRPTIIVPFANLLFYHIASRFRIQDLQWPTFLCQDAEASGM